MQVLHSLKERMKYLAMCKQIDIEEGESYI